MKLSSITKNLQKCGITALTILLGVIGTLAGPAIFICILILIICGFSKCCESATAYNNEINKDCYYFVADPIAAKEGEMQWLQLPYAEVNQHDRHVTFKLDGIEYTTSMYIYADTTK